MTPNAEQIKRIVADYSSIAQEAVTVRFTADWMYVDASELGALRLHYRMPGKIVMNKTDGTWTYFRKINLG